MIQKIQHAKDLIKKAIKNYPNIAVACSFGKDSIVTLDLAQQIKKHITVFSVMTKYKPKDTLRYLNKMDKKMEMNLSVYYVGSETPKELTGNGLEVNLLSPKK